jgi:hypothetical protein
VGTSRSQHNMAPSLPNFDEAEVFERRNQFIA